MANDFEQLFSQISEETSWSIEKITQYLLAMVGMNSSILDSNTELKDQAIYILSMENPQEHLLQMLQNLKDSGYYKN